MSTIKTIQYNNPSNFTYDASEVEINGSEAKLLPLPLQTNEMMVVTADVQTDADRAIDDNVTVRLGNGATRDDSAKEFLLSGTSYLSLNDDSGRDGVTPLTPTSQFQFGAEGTVRFKVEFNYSGTPATNNYLFTTGESVVTLGLGSVISVYHRNDGILYLNIRNAVASSTPEVSLGAFAPVAGQLYEFEFNTSQNTGASRLFIDGILHGTAGAAVTSATRDYFYFGTNYREDQGSSDIKVKDIQIINGVTHVANFTSEIPRIVNLFPLESRIETIETVLAEGFFSSTDVKTLDGTSNVTYVLKIENNLKWINGGAVAASDGSLAQSNTLAELTADAALITAFISAGARIVLHPILSSGPLGAYSPILESTTILYDFFAVPISHVDCVLYGFITDNIKPIQSGTVTVTTKKPILTQGNLISIGEVVNIDPTKDGLFEVELMIPNFKVESGVLVANGNKDLYDVLIEWIDSDGDSQKVKYKVLIPNATSIRLVDAVTAAL